MPEVQCRHHGASTNATANLLGMLGGPPAHYDVIVRLPKRACSSPGCGGIAERGPHCSACQQRIDAKRTSPRQRGYDEDHRRIRLLCFYRDGWRCVDCGWEPDIVRECREYHLGDPPNDAILEELRRRWHNNERHLHADHEIPVQVRPDLRLRLDNYRTRCNECHSAKTMREQHGTSGGGYTTPKGTPTHPASNDCKGAQ